MMSGEMLPGIKPTDRKPPGDDPRLKPALDYLSTYYREHMAMYGRRETTVWLAFVAVVSASWSLMSLSHLPFKGEPTIQMLFALAVSAAYVLAFVMWVFFERRRRDVAILMNATNDAALTWLQYGVPTALESKPRQLRTDQEAERPVPHDRSWDWVPKDVADVICYRSKNPPEKLRGLSTEFLGLALLALVPTGFALFRLWSLCP